MSILGEDSAVPGDKAALLQHRKRQITSHEERLRCPLVELLFRPGGFGDARKFWEPAVHRSAKRWGSPQHLARKQPKRNAATLARVAAPVRRHFSTKRPLQTRVVG